MDIKPEFIIKEEPADDTLTGNPAIKVEPTEEDIKIEPNDSPITVSSEIKVEDITPNASPQKMLQSPSIGHIRGLARNLDDQKRRSSSRSIKRKRFDDEIVEYSIGLPQSRGETHRVGRPRLITQPPYSHPPPTMPTPMMLPKVQPQPPVTAAEISAFNVVTAETTPVTADATPSTASTSTGTLPTLPKPPLERGERRRAPRSSYRRSRRAGRPPNQLTTKDLGRWKPIDDLNLIQGVVQTNDLRIVHRGTKFSCKFTFQEVQARWYALLYDSALSRTAVSAIRNLHPETIDAVNQQTLYSVAEEEQLGTIKSTDNPKLEHFQALIEKQAHVFYRSRTAKQLQSHWQSMKRYQLLPDQRVKPVQLNEPLSFSDAEDLMLDGELNETRNEQLEMEMELTNRSIKRRIRVLENEISRWSVLVDSMAGSGTTPEFDSQTLAVLRGRLVRYLMRSKEITFGRVSKDCVVDVDLSLEGPAGKISRRQGTIKLRSNGDFFIANEGKRPIFINGSPLTRGNKSRLSHNCSLELCGLRFVFLVNQDLINAIRRESAKTTTALN